MSLWAYLLKVWYDSGHILVDQRLIAVRYRDLPFIGFEWADMTGTDITKEKPYKTQNDSRKVDLTKIGKDNSLFCWIKNNWPEPLNGGNKKSGWLACDDGSMEIADFIHLDNKRKTKTLSLIHVKASKYHTISRQVSVTDYETVVGQAVKNLRFLDNIILTEGLVKGLRSRIKNKLVWHNGKPKNRSAMINALEKLGNDYQCRVVVVQPRLREGRFNKIKGQGSGLQYERLKQLYTLLSGARANCQALGAEFSVIGEK